MLFVTNAETMFYDQDFETTMMGQISTRLRIKKAKGMVEYVVTELRRKKIIFTYLRCCIKCFIEKD